MGGRMDVVYFGSGAFGLPTLAALAREHRVRAVVTQPDRPAGRGRALTPNPVAAWAAEHLAGCHGLSREGGEGHAPPDAGPVSLIQPDRVNDPTTVGQIRAFPADAWVVIAFGQKLGRDLLADRFAINLHASLLPRWRGAAPIHHAILAGDTQTGNSVITLADRMDAGLVLGQSHRDIPPDQTTGQLHDALAADGPELVLSVLNAHAQGTLRPIEQDESLVTLAGKLSRDDADLDFAQPADACRRRINALSPWPGVGVLLDTERLKLLRAAPADATPPLGEHPPGTLVDPDEGLIVCADGRAIRLLDVQPAGGRAMAWGEYARGRRPVRGALLRPGGA
jgi:methionyl-tRNA formyltransferase